MSESGNSENNLKRAWFIKPLKSVRSKGKQRKGAQAAKLDKREAGKSHGIRMTCFFIILQWDWLFPQCNVRCYKMS